MGTARLVGWQGWHHIIPYNCTIKQNVTANGQTGVTSVGCLLCQWILAMEPVAV